MPTTVACGCSDIADKQMFRVIIRMKQQVVGLEIAVNISQTMEVADKSDQSSTDCRSSVDVRFVFIQVVPESAFGTVHDKAVFRPTRIFPLIDFQAAMMSYDDTTKPAELFLFEQLHQKW